MFYNQVSESVEFLKEKGVNSVQIGVILGSGLGSLVESVNHRIDIPYQDIPHFPLSQVEGHAGQLVYGSIGDKSVLMMQGRFHYYEGFSMKEVTYPIYCMKLLGITHLIVTNACGAINEELQPGDIMLIDDFINGVSDNPLRGVNDERFGVRFPDMSVPYDPALQELAQELFNTDKPLRKGIYAYFQGPYYESRAEIQMYKKLGADAIGMSTVPETIVGNYLGLKVLGLSCITNMATGIRKTKHSHQEVVEIAQQTSQKLTQLVKSIIENI